MLKKLVVKNFKAICEMTIQFTPFTMLIGGNSSGKTTVLQALDFLRSIATRDIDEYLSERGWNFPDLKSQLMGNSKEPIVFESSFSFRNNTRNIDIDWFLSINYLKDQWVIQENIVDKSTKETLLSHDNSSDKNSMDKPYPFSQFKLRSSGLKLIDSDFESDGESKTAEGLRDIKRFLAASSSFELLSPEKMRNRGNRGEVSDIGMGGEKLISFLHGMDKNQKVEFNKIFSDLVGYEVCVVTDIKGQPGWIEMYMREKFPPSSTQIKIKYISDGLLRLMAFAAISTPKGQEQLSLFPEESPSGMILLDEIEDGINIHLAERVIALFKNITEKSARQVIATTHSSVFIDYIDPAELLFLWKKREGSLACEPLFSSARMKETLDFLNPGEVLLNYNKDEILERLTVEREGNGQ